MHVVFVVGVDSVKQSVHITLAPKQTVTPGFIKLVLKELVSHLFYRRYQTKLILKSRHSSELFRFKQVFT